MANMWYDKYPGVPLRGSPLETLFSLVSVERKKAELLATRALVLGSLAQLVKDQQSAKEAIEGFQKYSEAMFPFLERAEDTERNRAMKALLEHVKHPMGINIGDIRKERAAKARSKGMQKYKVRKVEVPGISGWGKK